jgi:hypothetical protein
MGSLRPPPPPLPPDTASARNPASRRPPLGAAAASPRRSVRPRNRATSATDGLDGAAPTRAGARSGRWAATLAAIEAAHAVLTVTVTESRR